MPYDDDIFLWISEYQTSTLQDTEQFQFGELPSTKGVHTRWLGQVTGSTAMLLFQLFFNF